MTYALGANSLSRALSHFKVLDAVFEDNLSTTYRAVDIVGDRPVSVRLFSKAAGGLLTETLLRFRRELESVALLDHANLLRIYEIGEFEGTCYVVTEPVEGTRLLSGMLAGAVDIDQAVEIMLQICSGIACAHEQGIIHQTINPSNILIFSSDAQITAKVSGFGLAMLLDLASIKEEEQIVGILGYMSPEETGILRKPINERSDIYSLGIMFYHLVTGMLPYDGRDTSTLIHQHIAQKPAPPRRSNPLVPPVIERIILRLSAKDPLNRYQTVSGLISDLKKYQLLKTEAGEAPDFEIAGSDRADELSFATCLVGREKELNALQRLISQTREAQGGIALVYGEAGVGKSRLVDELREYVHGIGGIFIGSKAYQYGSRAPYRIFGEALDVYVERLKRSSDKERKAAIERMRKSLGELAGEVIKIVPSMVGLIGEPPELVTLEPEKEKTRFLITVARFLLGLGRPQSPLVLFLDDLQWADEGSIDLLGLVAENIGSSHPIAVLVCYRDTEVDSGHPLSGAIDKMREKAVPLVEIRVKPFLLHDTSRILSEILLEESGALLPFAQELQKRTGGNPFFVLELLHSIVDKKVVYFEDDHYRFDMERLRAAALPADVTEVTIRRMLDDITEENRGILAYASILGRGIEFELLSELAGIPREKVFDALEDAIEKQFLARDITSGNRLFFMHDRIQQALYESVPEQEKSALHGKIAHLLEERNRDNLEPVLFELAHHFAQAGIEEKTLLYSIKAGAKAQASYAHEQAVRLYEGATAIFRKQGRTATAEYTDVLENLGVAAYQSGRFDQSLEALKTCESLIPESDRFRKAEVLSKIGDALQKKGELSNCERVLVAGLRYLGIRLPGNGFTAGLCIGSQFLVHGFQSVFPGVFVKKNYSGDPKSEIVARLLYRLFYLYYFTDLIKGICVLFRCLNMSERRLGPSCILSKIYAITGMAWSQIGWPFWARRNSRLSEKIAENLNDKVCIGLASAFHAIVENPHRPAACVRLENKAVALLRGVGEYWDLGHAVCLRSWAESMLGKNFNELIRENEEQIILMRSINALQNMGWVLGMKGLFLTYIGDEKLKTEGIAALEESIRLLKEVNDKPWIVCAYGYLAYAHLRTGNYEEAVRTADRVVEIYPSHNNLVTWNLDILGMCAHIYLYVANNPDLPQTERRKYLRRARGLCMLARFKGWMYESYRGWAYLVNGTYQWLTGRKKRAVRTWDQGIAYLRTHTQDSYRLACILLEEASLLVKDAPAEAKARDYLLEAKRLFTPLGATLELRRTEQLLDAAAGGAEVVKFHQVLTLKRQLESLLSVTKTIGSVLSLEELLDKIIDQAIKVTGAERGFLLLYDENDKTLRQKVSRGVDEAELARSGFSFENCQISLAMIQQVEETGEGLVEGQNGGALPKIAAELKRYHVKETLCVPLRAKNRPLGMIYLDNRMAGGVFGKDELELMSSFAVQAAISIENATLFSRTMTLNKELEQRIKETERAEKEKEKLQSQLLQAQKLEAIGTLAGGIAHDFNNMLQAITGYTELLATTMPADDRSQRYLDQILGTAGRAAELVKRLLILSRRIESQLRPVNLNEEVIRVSDLLRRMIPQMIEIQLNLAKNPELINADPIQLEQVMMNLGVNAKDAMPEGGTFVFETKNVQLDEQYCRTNIDAVPGRYVLLSVSDTGHGMDAQTLQRIFDPFFSTKEAGKGTGLGLAVSYGIVKSHGGHIKCHSEPGKGAVFTIYLPVLEKNTDAMESAPGHMPAILDGRETILLVDDLESLRELGKDLLEKHGYTVITAESGEKAIELYRQEKSRIALVILDIGMPGMGGRKCLKELLEINPNIKVLVSSGYADSHNKKDLLEAGASAFIGKPYSHSHILSEVRHVLEGEK